ncbi:hypothetical protein EV359DRAFT_65186 [Lentinula novae-zelandiae]|nr:hypothetical protein EV359DRAFT_65186 [Lentinula novae-zelandiae]
MEQAIVINRVESQYRQWQREKRRDKLSRKKYRLISSELSSVLVWLEQPSFCVHSPSFILELPVDWKVEEDIALQLDSEAVKDAFEMYLSVAIKGGGKKRKGEKKDSSLLVSEYIHHSWSEI